MKTSSAKNKGRRFQQWVRDKLIECLGIDPEDIKSTSMGAGGEDVILAKAARELFPYSIECKNVEKLNVWAAYDQAVANCGEYEPILFIRRNRVPKPLAVVSAEYLIKLQDTINKLKRGNTSAI